MMPFKGLEALLKPLPEEVKFPHKNDIIDLMIWCFNIRDELEENLPKYMLDIHKNGSIWVCWYKKASKKQKDVNEDVIRDTSLALGLIDVKVCAVNEEWSGLKLIHRLENR